MATYVLVHGGWSGGWIFRDVAAYLQAAGHTVFRPTLTGIGERVHLAMPNVGLNTNTLDIVNLLRFEELTDVILVGYSFGGIVITNVADRVPERLSHLVYLDAFVPEDGQSHADLLGSDVMANVFKAANEYGDGWRLPHNPPDAPGRTDQPLKPGLDPVRFQDPRALALPRTFILFTEGKDPVDPGLGSPLLHAAEEAQRNPAWGYYDLPCGHIFWEDTSEEVARVLAQLAS